MSLEPYIQAGLRFLLLTPILEPNFSNHVCKTFADYNNLGTSKNCYPNPDIFLTTPQLIKKYIGPVESFTVTTEDGYILTLYRIPREDPKKIILLHHPLTADASIFVGQGNQSLAFFLWRAGYEIWLSNQRGTPPSTAHQNLTTSDFVYWNYSFHEVGLFDLPATLDFIHRKVARKITYVGHSMGTTAALVYASLRPEEASELIETMVLISPSAFYKHAGLVLRLAEFEPVLTRLVNFYQVGSVWFFDKGGERISQLFLQYYPKGLYYLNRLMCAIYGWSPQETDPIFIHPHFFTTIKNFSWKCLLHYLQMMRSPDGRFQMFDHGVDNLQIYGEEKPPEYPLEKIRVPVILMHAEKDGITGLPDTIAIQQKIINATTRVEIIKGINHTQIYHGRHRVLRFIYKLLEILGKI